MHEGEFGSRLICLKVLNTHRETERRMAEDIKPLQLFQAAFVNRLLLTQLRNSFLSEVKHPLLLEKV